MSRNRWLPKRGQSLVEYALIVPLLFAMMFIIIELGIMFSIYVGLTNMAREGARAGVAYQYPNPTAFMGQDAATARSTVDAERHTVMNAAIMATVNPIMTVTDINNLNPLPQRYTYTPDPPDPYDIYRYRSDVTVNLAYEHVFFFGSLDLGFIKFPQSVTIRTNSKMRLEPGG